MNTVKPRTGTVHSPGFALIVTLSLMILLTIVAVGLLTLSSISLRASNQGEAMQVARANARLALVLAIGDLQKQLGPDTRISTTADQISTADPSSTTTPLAQRNWAGAYESWPAAIPSQARPEPTFLQWFVSGDPTQVNKSSFAGSALGTNSVEIVTENTVGPDGDPVSVPLLTHNHANGSKDKCAWWVSDLGTKGLIAASQGEAAGIADARLGLQSAPSFNIKDSKAGASTPFSSISMTDPDLAKISSWQSSSLFADKPANIRGLFHDLTADNRGLLTNVRAGGFRRDLSMEFEQSANRISSTPLYTIGREGGINLQELWSYYNLYKELRRNGSANFTTGGRMSRNAPYLQLESSPTACQGDDAFYFKQPAIIGYQIVLSFETRRVTVGRNQVYRLHMVADPIVTWWNPLDVPVVVPANSYFSVKYWQIPYDLQISVNGQAAKVYPLAASLSGSRINNNADFNFLTLRVGKLQQIVLKPGEVLKTSQSGNSIVQSSTPIGHSLDGKSGFNYGGGVSVPVRDLNGAYVDLTSPTDTITYTARANGLTSGKTSNSGNSITGGNQHTRHFSITHHEVYVGDDRGSSSNSLGVGGMIIDWDFGNKRLGSNETRVQNTPGTKPSGERLYANRFPKIFKPLLEVDARPLSASDIERSKAPFMLFSFNAKTETTSERGTKALSRFNPNALHVDFYDLSDKERDILPYEYTVQPLASWKNNSLEVSTNGNAFFGGGLDAQTGTSFVTTHSVPREPIVSLAAFQHSFANGFLTQRPKYGYATLNAREPLLPQISHAIGNSMACPILGNDRTEGSLPGGRATADHSYLANQALWDDWFLSGIAPQTGTTFNRSRNQKTVASEFFKGSAKLPVQRFVADLLGKDADDVIRTYWPGSTPSSRASGEIASLIRVDGMFNVNSTSVEAWKSVLGACKERAVVVRDQTGAESMEAGSNDTPVAGIMSPTPGILNADNSVDLQDPDQWTGRRTLDDNEIDKLAKAIVKEVRKRGPFLSLADFVNRRVGSDKELARSGAIQSALDSPDTDINSGFASGGRSVGSEASSRFEFGDAEDGPISYGIPGIIKQADILTPIAPILSARSDSFLVRAYGETTDRNGKVIARAWCEAVVQRSPRFVDPADEPETTYQSINPLNKRFGRRFDMVSFRWLNGNEA